MTQALKDQFNQMASGREAIEEQINLKDSEIENIQMSNPRAMEEYNSRREKIEKTRRALEDQQDNVQVLKAKIEELKVISSKSWISYNVLILHSLKFCDQPQAFRADGDDMKLKSDPSRTLHMLVVFWYLFEKVLIREGGHFEGAATLAFYRSFASLSQCFNLWELWLTNPKTHHQECFWGSKRTCEKQILLDEKKLYEVVRAMATITISNTLRHQEVWTDIRPFGIWIITAHLLQAAWLPKLKRTVEDINRNFGRSFERIGCAGEVQLYEETDPETGQEDFEKYAIHIKVRYRAEEGLQLLTAQRQSGGERSVATILYLIAIQVKALYLHCF